MAKKFEQMETTKYTTVQKTAMEAAAEVKEKPRRTDRLNIYATPENAAFVRMAARAEGKSINQFLEDLITAYREAHPEYEEAEKAFKKALEAAKK